MVAFQIFLAVIPSLILIIFIYSRDKYDREPVGLLISVFVLGMLAVIPVLVVETIGEWLNIFTGLVGILIKAFVVVALTEEYFKRSVVMRVAFSHPAYNERLDGIIYCAVASLGFATVENISYVITYWADQPSLWLTRALLSVPTHMLLGITMGYFLSMAKYCINPQLSKKYYRMSLTVPVILHGIYDFILMSDSGFLFLFFYPFVIYLWINNVKKLNIYYKESKHTHEGF